MASVGGVVCDFVKGGFSSQRERVQLWQVAGLDGYGAHLLGLGESDFNYRLVRYGTVASVDTFFAAIESKQGQVVTIVDDFDDSIVNMLIVRAGLPIKKAEIGNGGARGEIEIMGVKV